MKLPMLRDFITHIFICVHIVISELYIIDLVLFGVVPCHSVIV